ncbi:hypothetical protein ACEOWG_001878 [Bacillus cereus]
MGEIVKPDWDKFKAKFSDNPQSNFERFCYLLFCKQYSKNKGIFRYKNQSGIETNPINLDGKVIGWQAKFYEATLSNYKSELIETLKKAKRDYININTLLFYTNQEWGQGKKSNDSQIKKDVEAKANELGIDVVWNTASFFESPFVAIHNRNIANHFFCLEESMIDRINKRIIPRVEELNEQYKSTFRAIGGKFLPREEVDLCVENLKIGKSIIIHGKAGQGKSGCTHGVISYCEDNKIPYISIKLDDRVPSYNIDKWGEELGLTTSIDEALHLISENESGVIILDQLDALRWTQVHSRQALITCSEIIKRVTDINKIRNKKISIIFVCRTYDYENDNNIRSLFNQSKQEQRKEEAIEWVEIVVNGLDEATVRDIVGKRYDELSGKMKLILSIPSNLYIWEHLDQDRMYDDYSTANQLIQGWWNQLIENCVENRIDELEVESAKQEIIDKIDKHGKLYVSCKILNVTRKSLVYLRSNGFVTVVNNNISFSHQSIADYFFAQEMLKKYFEGENITDIIGDKQKQTPQKRYQIQMLLQDIQALDDEKFIEVGIQMLESKDIRFYVKYVFLEVLGQCTFISSSIKKFILEYCEEDVFGRHIIDSVINGHPLFVDILLENKILDKWMQIDHMKDIAINLIVSLCPKYTEKEVQFIRNYLFNSRADDEKISGCFSFNIHEDIDAMFQLRMQFYDKYPEMIDYIDFRELFRNCELRAIKIFELMLKNELKGKKVYYNQEKFLDETSETFIKNAELILDVLLPYIPREKDDSFYSKWHEQDSYNNSIERTCVKIIKKANVVLINKNPQKLMGIYNDFIGKGYTVFNEIILAGFEKLPTAFSTEIIQYIVNNFNDIIFDKSSECNNELDITKAILKKHAMYCSEDIFEELENRIIHYIDPRAKDSYRRRIEYNRSKERETYIYLSFWGDLQIELLSCLPKNKMSIKAKGLLDVLKRRFKNETNRYNRLIGRSGSVISPIKGKKLSNKQWLEVLNSKKICTRRKSRWIEGERGFIESSIEQFSQEFRDAVSSEPERFINLILKSNKDVHIEYIDSLFSGVAYSDYLNKVPAYLLESIILKYGYDYNSFRAMYICDILLKKENTEWSLSIINVLKDIAVNHIDPSNDKPNVTSADDTEMKSFNMLNSNALNCVRGSAASAIGKLLWSNGELYTQFKDTVAKLCNDINPAVRLASIEALCPIYNIDREFARTKILNMLEEDYRLAGYRGMRDLFFLMYSDSKDCVDKVILKCYYSADQDLIRVGAYSLTEIYITKAEHEELIYDVNNANETQAKNIVEMALLYFNKEEYNDKVKNLIKRYLVGNFDLEFPLCKIFHDNLLDIKRDKDFLIEVMVSDNSRRMIYSFVKYLEENAKAIIEYKDIILALSEGIIESYSEYKDNSWGINKELSKLIIGLYDESSQNRDEEMKMVADQCLLIWDLMFEKRIGLARMLTQQMLDR